MVGDIIEVCVALHNNPACTDAANASAVTYSPANFTHTSVTGKIQVEGDCNLLKPKLIYIK